MTTDVRLAKSHQPAFPDRCIACQGDPRGSTLALRTHSVGWWTYLFQMFGRWHRVAVPTCSDCIGKLKTQRRLRFLVMLLFAIGGGFAAKYILADFQGLFKRWIAIGIMIVVLLPFIVWEVAFPKPFDMTAHSSTVDYEFNNAEYAEEFRLLNEVNQSGMDLPET